MEENDYEASDQALLYVAVWQEAWCLIKALHYAEQAGDRQGQVGDCRIFFVPD